MTDQYLRIQYEKCRKQKKVLEFIQPTSLLTAIILAALCAEIIMLVIMIAGAVAIYHFKDWRFTAVIAAVIALSILCFFGFRAPECYTLILPLISTVICDYLWSRLKTQVGFPLFQYDFRPEESQKAKVYTSKKNAVESGVRATASDAQKDSEMKELFDESPEVLNAELKGYHDRHLNADPLVPVPEQHSELMDSLEEF